MEYVIIQYIFVSLVDVCELNEKSVYEMNDLKQLR